MEPTVASYEYAYKISKVAQNKNIVIKIHIAVDTGMGRIGFLPSIESLEEVYKISKLPNIEIESLFSHFSTADEGDKEYSYRQFEKYNLFYEQLVQKSVKINMKNIAAILGTINYEVLCMISKRVPRVYIKDSKINNVRNYI